jgi:hypothetical protein
VCITDPERPCIGKSDRQDWGILRLNGHSLVLDRTMFSVARALFSPGSAEDRSSLFVWFIDSMVRPTYQR